MKKSNWIVLAVAVVVSAFLLWLWYFLGFNRVDDPLDLVISIVWWAVIVLLVVLIIRAEKKRQRAIRSIYVSPSKLFNIEIGLVECPDPENRVQVMQQILDGLEYKFGNHAERPSTDEFEYLYIVDSDVYKHGDDSEYDKEPEWKGVVARVEDSHRTDFEDRDMLARIVG